jgi:hypothetical protein
LPSNEPPVPKLASAPPKLTSGADAEAAAEEMVV